MPPHTRSQRRRQGARQQQRQQRPINQPIQARDTGDVEQETLVTAPVNENLFDINEQPANTAATLTNSPRPASTRTTRRTRARTEPEPVDYSKDYQAARRDLRWIALWATLLFIVMIVLKVSGIV